MGGVWLRRFFLCETAFSFWSVGGCFFSPFLSFPFLFFFLNPCGKDSTHQGARGGEAGHPAGAAKVCPILRSLAFPLDFLSFVDASSCSAFSLTAILLVSCLDRLLYIVSCCDAFCSAFFLASFPSTCFVWSFDLLFGASCCSQCRQLAFPSCSDRLLYFSSSWSVATCLTISCFGLSPLLSYRLLGFFLPCFSLTAHCGLHGSLCCACSRH